MKRAIYLLLIMASLFIVVLNGNTNYLNLTEKDITPEIVNQIIESNRNLRSPSFNFTSIPYNLPDAIDISSGNQFYEDIVWIKDFTRHINNPDGDTLYLYHSIPDTTHFSISRSVSNPLALIFTPKPNWHGSELLILTISDEPLGRPDRTYSTAIVQINVTGVNDAPLFVDWSLIQTQFPEDSSFSIDFTPHIMCLDSAPSNFTLYVQQTQTTPPYNINFVQDPVTGHTVTFTPRNNYFGNTTFLITGVDRLTNAVADTTITITITPVNDAPVINSITPNNLIQLIPQNSILDFSINASDIDNPVLSYTWTYSGELNGVPFSTVISNADTVSHVFSYPGIFEVKCDVTDGENIVSRIWTITVQPIGPLFNPWGNVFYTDTLVELLPPAEYPNALIYYTLDGSDPDQSSNLYVAGNPISVNSIPNNDHIVVINAIYYETDLPPSTIISQTYHITGTVAEPVFDPDPNVLYYEEQNVVLNTATTGASIYWTDDGSDPIPGAPNTYLYSAPITIPVMTTKHIKAIAVKEYWLNSSVVSATYTLADIVHIVSHTFTPAPGNYDLPIGDSIAVSIGDLVLSPVDAVLYYTVDSSIPDPTNVNAQIYNPSQPIYVNSPTTIRIRAFKTDLLPSDIITAVYNVLGQVIINTYPAPNSSIFDPPPGFYTNPQLISLNATNPLGGNIYYTTNGSDPDSTSTLYINPIEVSATAEIKAIAYFTGLSHSPVYNGNFNITGTVATPVFYQASGVYNTSQVVTITSNTPDCIIYYTTDGQNPDETSTLYTSPITIPVGVTTLKAIAYKSNWIPSSIRSGTYYINTLPPPVFNRESGYYRYSINIEISTPLTPEAFITYTITTDGSEPDEPTVTSTLYTVPITVPANSQMQIKAKAFRSGWNSSSTTFRDYVVTGTVSMPEFAPAAGEYLSAQMVSIVSATPGSSIRYTTDGTNPTNVYGSEYINPILVTSGVTIKAIAYLHHWNDSPIATAVYSITGVVGSPIYTPPPAIYTSPQTVYLSATPNDAMIYYTLDGSDPSETNGTAYQQGIGQFISVNESVTIKARAYKTGWTPSGIIPAQYTITGTVDSPVFNPNPGEFATTVYVRITSTTPNANFRYTLDGTIPTESYGIIYSPADSITIAASSTLKAIAYKTNWISSPVVSGNYNINGYVSNPIFSPLGGTYSTPQMVSITTFPANSLIKYTLDGSDPNQTNAFVYQNPILVNTSMTIRAVGLKGNWLPSGISEATYSFNVATPTFAPTPGSYATNQTVTIACSTPATQIWYAFGDVDPVPNASNLYTAPIQVNQNTIIKAIATKAGWNPSLISRAQYTINGVLPAPTFSVLSGTYNSAFMATIYSVPADATIRYTTDGSEPTLTNGITYTTPVMISESTVLKAYAYRDSWLPSATSTVNYVLQASSPTANPPAGTYTSQQIVSLSTITPGAVIYYTTDGTNPNPGTSNIYSNPISINTSLNLKAIATKINWIASPILNAAYVIDITLPTVATPTFTPPASIVYTSAQDVYLSTTTTDAQIRYTIDGTNPSPTEGVLYNGTPISVSVSTLIKAIGYKVGYNNSEIANAYYIIDIPVPLVSTPTFDPPTGIYSSAQNVTITTTTPGATIHYTTDGTDPSESVGTVYTAPVVVSATQTIKAIAFRSGYQTSSIASAGYVINITIPTVDAPTFNPPAGVYGSAQLVEISTLTPDAIIHYSVDGSIPSETTGILYTTPIVVASSQTVKAIAFKAGFQTSVVSSATYAIGVVLPVVETPVFTPPEGPYTTAQSIVITTSTPDAQIRYTIDGSIPTDLIGTMYATPIDIPLNTTLVIKAIAYKTGYFNSQLAVATYTVTGQVAPVVFNPVGGSYSTPQNVLLTTATDAATIRYTTDGSEPTVASVLYTVAVNVPLNSTMTIKAKAFKTGWTPSTTTSETYTVTGQVAISAPVFTPATGNYINAISVALGTPNPADAVVYYTTDGSEPGLTNGMIYSNPFSLANAATVKAKAFKSGWTDSETYIADYVFSADNPGFNPPAGSYTTQQMVTISSATNGASIRYTLDGTEPSIVYGSLYTAPVTITQSAVLKAIAYKANWIASQVVDQIYIINGACAIPTINPLGGDYYDDQIISITTYPADATIRYTTDGTDPSPTSGLIYTTPFQISNSMVLKAIAFKTGWLDSQIASEQYNFIVRNPLLSLQQGTYTSAQTLTLSVNTPGAQIRYTTDGTIPSSTSGILYSAPIDISISQTIKVIAYKTGWTDSDVIQADYEITGQVADVVFNPLGGIYTEAQDIMLSSATPGATIRFTTDGSEPSEASASFTGTINIPLNTAMSIKAKAYKPGWIPGNTITQDYTVTGQVAMQMPVFNPVGGVYTSSQIVSINTPDPADAVVHYTTDGSNPTEASDIYMNPIQIPLNTSMTIKTRAYKDNWTPSDIITAQYTITGQAALTEPLFNPAPGLYTEPVNISINQTTIPTGATLRYTTDGSDPNGTSAIYTEPIGLGIDSAITIRVRAYLTDWTPSEIISASYRVTGQVVLTYPVFDPAPGVYNTPQSITISPPSLPTEAVIRYTLDGSDPTQNSPAYIQPIILPLDSNITIKVRGFSQDWAESPVESANYVITGIVENPVFSVAPGSYSDAFTVEITCSTENAVIRYTMDGTEPDETSELYEDPIEIPALAMNLNIKAKAFKENWISSSITSATYSVLLLPVNVRLNAFFGYIRVFWNSPVEVRTLDGFNVYRKRIDQTEYTKLNSSPIVTSDEEIYFYDDYNVEINQTYQYYVTAIYDGIESAGSNVSAIEYVAQELTISSSSHIYPNPATNSCIIKVIMNRNENVQVSVNIYDFTGKEVRKLNMPTVNSNLIELPWDLKTSDGKKVGRGTYFARVVVNNEINKSSKTIKIAVK